MKIFNFISKSKLNKKRALLQQIALLLATAMIFTVAVWAWFASNQEATASGLNVSMTTGNNLDISLDGGINYRPGIDLLSESDQIYISKINRILGTLNMQDITSDGTVFQRPAFNQTDGTLRIPDTTQDWSIAQPNQAYISQNIKFRTTFPADIYLGSNTEITTFTEESNLSLASNVAVQIGNKSTYGNFSRDCIVGALRISAIGDDTHRFTMIPRSDIELLTTDVTENNITTSVYTVSLNNTSANAKEHTYYNSNKVITTNNSPLLSSSATDTVTDDDAFLTTTTLGEDGYYTGSVVINIWLEGCDSEVKRALSGGKYNIHLDFVAHETES